MSNPIQAYAKKLLWNCLPPSCMLCNNTLSYAPRHPLVCTSCEGDLLSNDRACPKCAEPEPTNNLCRNCQTLTSAYQSVTAAFVYTPPLAGLITHYKYGKQPTLAKPLARLMLTQTLPPSLAMQKINAFVAVPMHPQRLQKRGFNQAQLLAQQLADFFHIPVLTSRVARTQPPLYQQAALDREERFLNMQYAFSTKENWHGLNILLIDDVMTTGATLNALANILLQGGAASVDAWVLARTPA